MLDGPDSEWFAFQISPIFSEVRHVYDLPAPYGPADWRRWPELKRSVLHVLNVSTLTPRCHNLKAIVFSADQQTGRGLADTCRILQHGPEYGLQLTGRPADDLENFGGRGEPLQRLVTLAGASRELRFLGGSGGTAATQLWRSAALWHFRLTAARFGLFAASSGAPCHGPPQGSELCAPPAYNGAITAGICDRRNGVRPSFCVATILRTECPLWVKSRHRTAFRQCPLYPRKRTSRSVAGMPANEIVCPDFVTHSNGIAAVVVRFVPLVVLRVS